MVEENPSTLDLAIERGKESAALLKDAKTLGRKIHPSFNPKLTYLYYPGKKALLVDIHGGGFCFKSVLDNDVYCDYLSRTYGVAVLNADFTLSYLAPYPQQLVDISAEVLSLLQKFNELATLPVYLIGHSSGANLAAALAIRFNQDMRIAGCLLNYPFLDLERDQSTRRELPDTFPTALLNDWIHLYCPYPELLGRSDVSPLAMSEEEAAHFPRSVITVATKDRLQDDGRSLARELTSALVDNKLIEVEERHGFIERHMRNILLTPNDPQVVNAKKVTDDSIHWLLNL
jgi:acetyl esterase/lipase